MKTVKGVYSSYLKSIIQSLSFSTSYCSFPSFFLFCASSRWSFSTSFSCFPFPFSFCFFLSSSFYPFVFFSTSFLSFSSCLSFLYFFLFNFLIIIYVSPLFPAPPSLLDVLFSSTFSFTYFFSFFIPRNLSSYSLCINSSSFFSSNHFYILLFHLLLFLSFSLLTMAIPFGRKFGSESESLNREKTAQQHLLATLFSHRSLIVFYNNPTQCKRWHNIYNNEIMSMVM